MAQARSSTTARPKADAAPRQRKAPQDRKPRQVRPKEGRNADGSYTFVGTDGEAYTLPPAVQAADTMAFGSMRSALQDPNKGATFMMALDALNHLDVDPDVLEALDHLSVTDGNRVINGWFFAPDGDGVTAPQS